MNDRLNSGARTLAALLGPFEHPGGEIDGKNLYFDGWDYNIRVWCDGREI